MDAGREHGRQASTPSEVPVAGWRDVLVRTLKEAKADGISLLAAGVAFYALLALAPAVTALVGIYGLVGDPADASRQVRDLLAAAPREVRDLVEEQLMTASQRSQSAAVLLVIVGVA